MKRTSRKRNSKQAGQPAAIGKRILVTDSEGGLPLPPEWGMKIGDEFAAWKKGETIILAFLKTYRGRVPKRAHRGKVEPALPETPMSPS